MDEKRTTVWVSRYDGRWCKSIVVSLYKSASRLVCGTLVCSKQSTDDYASGPPLVPTV